MIPTTMTTRPLSIPLVLLFFSVGWCTALDAPKGPKEALARRWGTIWSVAPTVVAAIKGATEVEVEAQTVLFPPLVLSAACDVAAVGPWLPSALIKLGVGYNPLGTGLSGPLLGLYPGCYLPLSPELAPAFSLTGRVQQQWLAPFGLLFSAGLGATYLFRPVDLFKWDLSLGVGFAFSTPNEAPLR